MQARGGEWNEKKSYKNTNTKFLHPIINYCYCQRVKYDYLLQIFVVFILVTDYSYVCCCCFAMRNGVLNWAFQGEEHKERGERERETERYAAKEVARENQTGIEGAVNKEAVCLVREQRRKNPLKFVFMSIDYNGRKFQKKNSPKIKSKYFCCL